MTALLALNGCGGEEDSPPPVEKEEEVDESLQGDLGGIRPAKPVHNAPASAVINGTNAVAQITWGEGASGGVFKYAGGTLIEASAVITARKDYVFDKAINRTDILDAFGSVTVDIDDSWTITEDCTQLSFAFSYFVDQAEISLASLKDVKLVSGITALPDFIEEDTLDNLDPESPPETAYLSAGTPETALTALPAAGTGFKVKVTATAAYGYKWPAGFDYKQVYESAAKATGRVSGSGLTLTLEYDSALQVINAIAAGNILALFNTAPAGGQQIPVKLLLGTGTAAPAFTVEKDLEWSGLASDQKVALASTSISTPVKLIPNRNYTFAGTTLTEAAIALAINATTFNHKVEVINKDHDLEFTLAYPITAVSIVPTDITASQISKIALSNFYHPRIGQEVYDELEANPAAKFEVASIVWSDETGNETLTAYTDRKIVASVTLKAKPGYTFSKVAADITSFTANLTGAFTVPSTGSGKAPVANVVGTPDETLIFTLTYEKAKLNPEIKIGTGNTVTVDKTILESGGGLAELFEVGGNTITIPKAADSSAITISSSAVIPAGKTLELGAGANVSFAALETEGTGKLTLGAASALTVSGASTITGDVTLGAESKITLTGGSDIKGNITFGTDSKVEVGGNSTIGDSTKTTAITLTGPKATTTTGPTPPPTSIEVATSATLELAGNVEATNVIIDLAANDSKINIPKGKILTIKAGAILLLSDKSSASEKDSGSLNGTIVVESGGTINDSNASPKAFEVCEDSQIIIKYGGTGIVNPSGNTPVIFVGTATTSSFVQLLKAEAVLTITKGKYTITGDIALAGSAVADAIVVEGSLTVKEGVSGLVFDDNQLTGTSTSSRLVIAGSSAPTTNKILIGTYTNTTDTTPTKVESAVPGAGSKTYAWVLATSTTGAHWREAPAAP
jgi:hypothetical protein